MTTLYGPTYENTSELRVVDTGQGCLRVEQGYEHELLDVPGVEALSQILFAWLRAEAGK